MPIVLTPTGQFVDSETGNTVDLPPENTTNRPKRRRI